MSELTEEYEAVRDQARRYLDDTAQPEHLKALLEVPGSFDATLWAGAVEQGWPAAALPELHDGLGLGWRGVCVLAEELGRKCASLPLVSSAAVAHILAASGTDQPQLAKLVSGERHACLALCQSGDAGLALRPEVRWSGQAISGGTAITAFGASADLALVPAWSDPANALVLVLVELNQPGVLRQNEPVIDNSRAAATLHFQNAPAQVLAEGRAAEALLWQAAALAAIGSAFEQIGGAQACLDMARDFALERKAFGQPIGRFQAIKSKLADIYIRVELARGCALDALAAFEDKRPDWHSLAAATRVAATDAYEISARETIQTHGAIGVTWEAMPHHHYRRSRSLALELGAAAIWRERLLATATFISTVQ
ncbi:MAG: acyl-CoA dehydrogenase family protein [Pseudomonadota bacterium]